MTAKRKQVMTWWNSMSENQKWAKVAQSRNDISLDKSKGYKDLSESDIQNIFHWNEVYGN